MRGSLPAVAVSATYSLDAPLEPSEMPGGKAERRVWDGQREMEGGGREEGSEGEVLLKLRC